MPRYHLKDSGDPGVCRAEISCPLGGDSLHFESKEAARAGYEAFMEPVEHSKLTPLKHLAEDGLRMALYSEANSAGLGLEAIHRGASLATLLHQGQYRSAAPGEKRPNYITHPLRNAVRVIRWGGHSTDLVLGALLHDVVEDSSERYAKLNSIAVTGEEHARVVLLDELKRSFNPNVARLVLKLSNPVVNPEQKATMTLEEKHAVYVDHVAEAIRGDHDVQALKGADLQDNAAGLYHTDFEGRKAQTERQARKYLKVVPVFQAELAAAPNPNAKLHAAVQNTIDLVDARMRWMLEKA